MGAVYEAIHLETKRRRALKVMLPSLVTDEELRGRFALEATVTADIESEHLVETFDAGVDSGTGAPFLVMELLRGEDLGAMVERQGRLSSTKTLLLLGQAAKALGKTHAAGIVHRDLKPENLFVTRREDGSMRLKVLDFGIAKVVAQSQTHAKATRSVGTPMYMSPEQVRGDGQIGPAADIYALGHITYALLVGCPYWEQEFNKSEGLYAGLLKIAAGAQVAASERAKERGVTLPSSFDAWFRRSTDPRPNARFASALEQMAALDRVLSGTPIGYEAAVNSAAHVPEARPTNEAAHTNAGISGDATPGGKRATIVGLVLGMVVTGLGGWALWTRLDAAPQAEVPASSVASPVASPNVLPSAVSTVGVGTAPIVTASQTSVVSVAPVESATAPVPTSSAKVPPKPVASSSSGKTKPPPKGTSTAYDPTMVR
jgi:serine/threonine-protein kinase